MRLVALCLLLAGCPGSAPPTPTETVCPDPDPLTLTYENFGEKFMTDYCTMCHASTLRGAQRNGAPFAHDFETLRGVLLLPHHIDEYAGKGPAAHNTIMPPGRCPSTPGGSLDRDCAQPSDAERTDLAMWIACETLRPHTF